MNRELIFEFFVNKEDFVIFVQYGLLQAQNWICNVMAEGKHLLLQNWYGLGLITMADF